MVMFANKSKTVDEYLKALPPERRAVVAKVRGVVKKHLPKGYEEAINWGAITYAIPLKTFPETYNGQPLCYAALAAQKNHYSLYLMNVYGDAARAKWLEAEFKKRGLKLDKGKACVRFKSLDELPLDVIAETIASVPPEKYIEIYQAARKKTAKGK
jgi:uncharacterized protein YdhG (YjbR/CyaY superfamily)